MGKKKHSVNIRDKNHLKPTKLIGYLYYKVIKLD